MSVPVQTLQVFRDRWRNKEALEFVSMILLLQEIISYIFPSNATLMV